MTFKVPGQTLQSVKTGIFSRVMAFELSKFFSGVNVDPGKDYDIEIKVHREKRSNDANSYFWAMLNRLAEKLGAKDIDLYRSYIRDYGVWADWDLPESREKTFCIAWGKLGRGWLTERLDYTGDGDTVRVRAWYGSSTYNTKQMSRLIEAVVQDCREMGIETRPQEEVESLLARWEPVKYG